MWYTLYWYGSSYVLLTGREGEMMRASERGRESGWWWTVNPSSTEIAFGSPFVPQPWTLKPPPLLPHSLLHPAVCLQRPYYRLRLQHCHSTENTEHAGMSPQRDSMVKHLCQSRALATVVLRFGIDTHFQVPFKFPLSVSASISPR